MRPVGAHIPARPSAAGPRFPHPTPTSAVPCTHHGTQAPPVPSASAAQPTPGDAAAVGHCVAVAPGEASEAAVPAVANATAAPSAAVATEMPAVAPPPAPHPSAPPGASSAHSGGATGAARLPLCIQCDRHCGHALLYIPGQPVVVDMCVTHPLASSAFAAAAWGTEMSAEAKGALKRDKYGPKGTTACRFIPMSHETYGRAGPPAVALLHELAEFLASTGAISKKIFTENAVCDLSTTLCSGMARQVLSSAPLQARLDGDHSSLGCLFQPLALPEASAPVLAPGSALAAYSCFCVRSAVARPPAPLPPTTRSLALPPPRSATPLPAFALPLPPSPPPGRAVLAVHQLLLIMGPPDGRPFVSPQRRVVSVL